MAEVVVYDKETGRIEQRSRGKVNPDLYQLNHPDKGIYYTESGCDWAAKFIEIDENGEAVFSHEKPRSLGAFASTFFKPSFLDPASPPAPKPKREGQKELALFRPIGIGDVIMSLPALSQIRQKYNDWYITYWTTKECARVLAEVPWLDRIGVVEYKKTKSLQPNLPTEVSDYNHAINWAGSIDFGKETWGTERADLFCARASVSPPVAFSYPPLNITKAQKAWAESIVGENQARGRRRVACILSSHGDSRSWPIENWEELAKQGHDKLFLWFSDKPQHSLPAPFPNVLNTANQLNFEEYIALLSVCDLIVCPDTSAYHLGEMLKIPSLVLEGSVDLGTRTKYHRYAHRLRLRLKLSCQPCYDFQMASDCYRKAGMPWCLSRISPRRVLRHIKRLL